MLLHHPAGKSASWVRGDDTDQYAAAAAVQADHPRWWVLWGPYTRRHWTYYLGEESVDPQSARTPREARQHIERAEQDLAVPPAARWRAGPSPPAGTGR
jgi:hypothetical protein